MAKIKALDCLEVGRLCEHTHVPDLEKEIVIKLRSQMKNHAKETMDKTRDILNNGQT